MRRMSVLHQKSGGIGKSIPSALEISLDPQDSRVSGNLLGVGDGFPNTSRVLVEYGYNAVDVLCCVWCTLQSNCVTVQVQRSCARFPQLLASTSTSCSESKRTDDCEKHLTRIYRRNIGAYCVRIFKILRFSLILDVQQ